MDKKEWQWFGIERDRTSIEHGRLKVEQDTLRLEEDRLRRDFRFINRHLGAIVGAVATFVGAILGALTLARNADQASAQIAAAERLRHQEYVKTADREERRLRFEVAEFVSKNRDAVETSDVGAQPFRDLLLALIPTETLTVPLAVLRKGESPPGPERIEIPRVWRSKYHTSGDCSERLQPRSDEWCLEGDATVSDPAELFPTVTTYGCGSDVGVPSISPGKPNCITIPVNIRGCGYSLGWLCNGQGWLGYRVALRGTKPKPPEATSAPLFISSELTPGGFRHFYADERQVPGCSCGPSKVRVDPAVITTRSNEWAELRWDGAWICQGQGISGGRGGGTVWWDGQTPETLPDASGIARVKYSKAGTYSVRFSVSATCIDDKAPPPCNTVGNRCSAEGLAVITVN